MELKDILAKCDHTLLGQASTWADIKAICDDGMKYNTASVCIPASFVKQAKEYAVEYDKVKEKRNGKFTCLLLDHYEDNYTDSRIESLLMDSWKKEVLENKGRRARKTESLQIAFSYSSSIYFCVPFSYVWRKICYVSSSGTGRIR